MTRGPQLSTYMLGKIFCYLCGDGPLPLRHLLFVSKMFFYAAINNAQLWTTISLDSDFINHFKRRPAKHAKGFIKQCLLHSGQLPLSLRIVHLLDMATISGPLQIFKDPKYRGAERCTSLILDCEWNSSSIGRILDLLPRELSSLQHLSLSHFEDPVDGSQFPNCPSLERVEILDHLRPSALFWKTNFAHVTTLSFGNTNSWGHFDIVTLLLFPLLHDLTLSTIQTGKDWGNFYSQLPVQLHYLQILRVHGAIPTEVFDRLAAPSLEELHIEANALHLTSIAALSESFEPLCLHLHALLPETVSIESPRWPADLSWLVKECTRLENLYISKWMEEECKRFTEHSEVVLHVL